MLLSCMSMRHWDHLLKLQAYSIANLFIISTRSFENIDKIISSLKCLSRFLSLFSLAIDLYTYLLWQFNVAKKISHYCVSLMLLYCNRCIRSMELFHLVGSSGPTQLYDKKTSLRLLSALHDKITARHGSKTAHRVRIVSFGSCSLFKYVWCHHYHLIGHCSPEVLAWADLLNTATWRLFGNAY